MGTAGAPVSVVAGVSAVAAGALCAAGAASAGASAGFSFWLQPVISTVAAIDAINARTNKRACIAILRMAGPALLQTLPAGKQSDQLVSLEVLLQVAIGVVSARVLHE